MSDFALSAIRKKFEPLAGDLTAPVLLKSKGGCYDHMRPGDRIVVNHFADDKSARKGAVMGIEHRTVRSAVFGNLKSLLAQFSPGVDTLGEKFDPTKPDGVMYVAVFFN